MKLLQDPGSPGVREHLLSLGVDRKLLLVITLLGVDVSARPLIESYLSDSLSW